MNTASGFIREFYSNIPRYAILSHTWDDDEQTFQDLQQLVNDVKSDHSHEVPIVEDLTPKLRNCCNFAAAMGYKWVWIDTCCIDKRSTRY